MTHQNELPIGLTERLAQPPSRRGIIIAIDPGASGGFAIQHPGGAIEVHAMPESDVDTLDLLRSTRQKAIAEGAEICAVMEQVGGFVAAGGGQPGSRMFNFGEGFGFLRGALLALGIPLRMVQPKAWQKGLCLGAPVDKSARKRALKSKAVEMFPHLKPTLKTCDALLILDWANRVL